MKRSTMEFESITNDEAQFFTLSYKRKGKVREGEREKEKEKEKGCRQTQCLIIIMLGQQFASGFLFYALRLPTFTQLLL